MAVPDQSLPEYAVHARVYGRVQGVGFRYFTRSTAASLGLSGWVKNRMDGSVEVRAEGSRAQVEALVDYLRHGPPSSHVRTVDLRYPEPTGSFRDFSVSV